MTICFGIYRWCHITECGCRQADMQSTYTSSRDQGESAQDNVQAVHYLGEAAQALENSQAERKINSHHHRALRQHKQRKPR